MTIEVKAEIRLKPDAASNEPPKLVVSELKASRPPRGRKKE